MQELPQQATPEKKSTAVEMHRRLAKLRAQYPQLFKARVLAHSGTGHLRNANVGDIANAPVAGKSNAAPSPMLLKSQTVPLGRELWANVMQSSRWLPDAPEYGIYSFNASESMFINEKYVSPYIYANAGGTLAGNRLDVITWDSYYGSMAHYCFDADTGDYIEGSYLPDYSLWSTETAVASDGTVYGDFYSSDASRYELGIVDYANNTRTTIGQLYNYYVALGITKDNVLYGVATDGNLYRIDSSTAKETLVGPTGVGVMRSDGNWNVQSGEIDQATGIFYWACTDNTNHSALYSIDLSTGSATKIGDMSGNEQMTLLSIPKETVDSEAPSLAGNFAVSFSQASLSGEVSFTAPTTTYMGEKLSGTLKYNVYVDGKTSATGSVEPGADVSVPISAKRGNHMFAVSLSNAAGEGPKAYMSRFVGDDTPQAVGKVNASLDAATGKVSLNWSPVTSGINGGYVSDITYNVVRYPDAKAIATGTSATTAEDVLPNGELTGYYYTVVAVSGSYKSDATKSNSVTFGEVPEPPFSAGFDNEESLNTFTIIDANNDGNTWSFLQDDGSGQSSVQISYGDNDHDDWLITPPLKLKAGSLYNISYRVACKGTSYPELLEVMYGNEPTVDGMKNQLVEKSEITNAQYVTVTRELVPEKDGVYYFGFHCTSDANWCYQLVLDDITVTGNSQKSPDAASIISVTPASDGSNKAVVKFAAPSVAIDGSALDGTLDVVVKRDGKEIQTMSAIVPGKEYSYTDTEAINGFNSYTVVARNDAGEGRESEAVKAYVGLDIPASVENIKASNDANSITLSWSPVTTGDNGGYVNPDDIYYNVYNIFENGAGVDLKIIDQTDETTLTFPYDTNTGEQQMVNFALSAQNSLSEGPRAMSPGVIVGKPYELPFEEHFKGGRLDHSMWWINGGKNSSEYQLMQGLSADGDGGCAGYVSAADDDFGTLGSGKISLQGAKNPVLVFSYMPSDASCSGTIKVYGVKPDGSEEQLSVTDFGKSGSGAKEWHVVSVDIPGSYTSLPYAEFNFVTSAQAGAVVYFDNIYLRDVVDTDLRTTLSVPSKVRKGETVAANVEVTNMGNSEVSAYTVNLYAGGKLVQTATADKPLAPYATAKVPMEYATSIMDASPLKIKAEAVVDGDATPDDNVATAEVELLASTKTAPTDVTATTAGGKVELKWTKVNETAETVTDDFESYTPWSMDEFGEWTAVYGEKGLAKGPFSRTYPHVNEGKRFAFTLVQPDTWVDSQVLDNYACIKPESGKCYLASFYSVENSQFIVADNWLISPSLTGEKQTVKFWANNFTSSTMSYPEDFEVLYSTSGTTLNDFKSMDKKFTADGGVWKEYSVELPEGSTYFAIHNNTADTYMFMVDNVTYRAGSGKVVGYNIYVDGVLAAQVSADADSFSGAVADGSHVYSVSAVYAGGESEPTQASVLTSVGGVEVALPQVFDVYTVDGKLVAKSVSSLKGLHNGVYVVNNNKVVVK